jgi:hypothetical protein
MSEEYPPTQPTQAQPAVPAAEPDRKRRWLLPTLVGVGAFLLGIGIGAAGGGTDSTTDPVAEPAPTVTVAGEVPQDELDALEARAAELDQREADLAAREAAVAETEQEAAEGTIPGDGTYLVGSDIQAGEYRASPGDTCYWARLSGTGGDLSDVIANDLPTGPTVVTISESDYAFETSGCGEWTLVQ